MEIILLIFAGILCAGPTIAILIASKRVDSQLVDIHDIVNDRLTRALDEIVALRETVASQQETIRQHDE